MDKEDAVINLFALAHPGRLQIFKLLVLAGKGGMAAGKIAQQINIPANTASTHLSILSGAGLLSAYRDGRSIIYRAQLDQISHLIGFLLNDCANGDAEVKAALKAYF